MRKTFSTFTIIGVIIILSCTTQTYHEKMVEFKPDTPFNKKVMMAAQVVPTSQQLEWQKLELTAFIHFGINTFTEQEWGDGTESPSLFNPTQLNAIQCVQTLKDGGMRMVILTAKHHDGFCLWPTKTTSHSIAASPWLNGAGDLVREVKNACDSLGLKFGIYLSPWDRNAQSYGDSPKYNEFFRQQLIELLTWYGKVDEIWFDGACGEGPNGKKQEYDWESYYAIIEKLQPNAVVAIKGEDIRWVGTETGYGRPTEWSVTAFAPGGKLEHQKINEQLGLTEMSADLGSQQLIEKANALFWYPAEVDVSIRPGWFYHQKDDNQVKSLPELTDIYFNSVGMNAVLLLNVPPDKRGLIHEIDALRLKEFKTWIDASFKENIALCGRSNERDGQKTLDGNSENYWTASSFPSQLEITFNEEVLFDIIEIKEFTQKGQRVEAFTVEAEIDGTWQEVGSGTTIGYKRLLYIKPVRTEKVRITILKSRYDALISGIGLYKSA